MFYKVATPEGSFLKLLGAKLAPTEILAPT
jgi:hypothetical protein